MPQRLTLSIERIGRQVESETGFPDSENAAVSQESGKAAQEPQEEEGSSSMQRPRGFSTCLGGPFPNGDGIDDL